MRKTFVIGLTLVFLFAMTAAAFAAPGIVPTDEITIPLDQDNQGGYLDPTAGVNPHGSYSTTSNKCKTCHAVHGATAGGEALLRSTKANACVYCHITGGFAIKLPYGNVAANYTTEYENNHASNHQTSAYVGCVSCHSVHGANTMGGAFASKILKTSPGSGVVNVGVGALTAAATTVDEFCRDCHDGTSAVAGSTANNATTGCSGCHATQMMVSNPAQRDFVSHVMTTTLTNANSVTVSSAVSTTCRSCHKGAQTYADANSFPHLTSGADFLTDTHTSTSPLDRVCLECHVWNAGASGVGQTF